MVKVALREGIKDHRIVDCRRGRDINQPWLSHPLIAGHWEERCRFGLEGFLELSSKLFSHNDGRVEGVVDYERSVEVWERLKTVVSYGRQIDGCSGYFLGKGSFFRFWLNLIKAQSECGCC